MSNDDGDQVAVGVATRVVDGVLVDGVRRGRAGGLGDGTQHGVGWFGVPLGGVSPSSARSQRRKR